MSLEIAKDILSGWKIVVVDDDPDSLDVASIILLYYGATVHTATNGQEGMALVKSIRPRFVIADISMPVMDGWTMIDTLQQDTATNAIPVIALTAHAMPGDRAKAIAAGFHNYLTKPLTPDTFISDLLRLLDDVPELATALKR